VPLLGVTISPNSFLVIAVKIFLADFLGFDIVFPSRLACAEIALATSSINWSSF
jgi:hypothetical protein